MKGQDTRDALDALADGPPDLAVACLQNGVDNERQVLRRTPNTYAVPVMLPATYLEPGVVDASSAPVTGILDVGRYPTGVDDAGRGHVGRVRGLDVQLGHQPGRSCASSGRSS